MQFQAPSPRPNSEDITVLRIKRKRDQEPLEALVIHQQQQQRRRKIPRGLSGRNSTDSLASEWEKSNNSNNPMLFKFGETISETDFGNTAKRQALQTRLASLAKHKLQDEMDVEGQQSDKPAADAQQPPTLMDGRQSTYRVVGKRELLLDDSVPYGRAAPRNMIPQVVSAAELHKEKQRIKMLDAIHADDFETAIYTRESDPYAEVALGAAKDSKVVAANPRTVDELVPIVQDYLSLDGRRTEYVYDFYYIQKSHAGIDPNVLRANNVGSVLWIDDVNEFLGDSDSDINDEDEDSNAEDFYRNDYPDEPDSDSGMDDYYNSAGEHSDIMEEVYEAEYDY
ncbi:hypothetical protein IWW55_001976 [Coemansia sp. RSA 2706]|nr:hypothetical protein IWW55_001976 [Coemansia sp. RSA 2706]KAJ2310237.1 hypothetical protein IWW54_003297 [Coemansia sp. RSA 2705]KAJ2321538.1 hypothetical protein IWW52_000689 [Coemansia sp. RSA 2704]KAJ2737598.1 hypothetical protein H4R23_001723 [Coemansia sp. Cherry 401B]